eukprot:scaffold30187_cov24-Prasinocladus_malaysianus.AAC.1
MHQFLLCLDAVDDKILLNSNIYFTTSQVIPSFVLMSAETQDRTDCFNRHSIAMCQQLPEKVTSVDSTYY